MYIYAPRAARLFMEACDDLTWERVVGILQDCDLSLGDIADCLIQNAMEPKDLRRSRRPALVETEYLMDSSLGQSPGGYGKVLRALLGSSVGFPMVHIVMELIKYIRLVYADNPQERKQQLKELTDAIEAYTGDEQIAFNCMEKAIEEVDS